MADGRDREILRELAMRFRDSVDRDRENEKRDLWRRLNDLDSLRPMTWINEIPWEEIDVDGELALRCADPTAQWVEGRLRRALYSLRHFALDMIHDTRFIVPLVVTHTGFGVADETQRLQAREQGAVHAQHYEPVIRELADAEKISSPRVRLDEATTSLREQLAQDTIGDILPVIRRGIVHTWFSPWDILVRWLGVQEGLLNLYMRPEVVHLAMERLTTAHLAILDQWESMGILATGDGNWRVGSGGLGCTSDLEEPASGAPVKPCHQWGCAAAQILGEVSPAMHEEFALAYERRWLERFGLTYYGCCEPLHGKIDILRSIPNLRKISICPFANLEAAAEAIGRDYVISWKPNPAAVAWSTWEPNLVRRQIRESLAHLKGCHVEVILKDISTCNRDPHRLREWCRIVQEECGHLG